MKALIFDLDGTLVDSVYPHTLAWRTALLEFGLPCPAWSIHRRIGMSGKLLVKAVARDHNHTLSDADIESLAERHASVFRQLSSMCIPFAGAVDLLAHLAELKIPHGIATSGTHKDIERFLKEFGLCSTAVVVTADMVREGKPEPDLFLTCQRQLGVDRDDCLIVGDAIWDIHAARRSGIVSIGVLTGGFGEQELYNAGAMRVYRDVQAIHQAIEELGFG